MVWGDLYDVIFHGRAAEPYVLAFQIYQDIARRLQESALVRDKDNVRRKIANNSAFHVARIAAFLWRGTDNWDGNIDDLVKRIEQLKEGTRALARHFRKAFDLLETVVRARREFARDIDGAFKAHELDDAISAALHSPPKRKASKKKVSQATWRKK